MLLSVSSRTEEGMPWLITWKKPHVAAASLICWMISGRWAGLWRLARSSRGMELVLDYSEEEFLVGV